MTSQIRSTSKGERPRTKRARWRSMIARAAATPSSVHPSPVLPSSAVRTMSVIAGSQYHREYGWRYSG